MVLATANPTTHAHIKTTMTYPTVRGPISLVKALTEDLLRYQSLIDVNSDALVALQDAIAKIRGNAPLPEAVLQHPTSDADKLRTAQSEAMTVEEMSHFLDELEASS
jgi:hypothetical protein